MRKEKIDEKRKSLEREFDAKLGFQGELIKSNFRVGMLPCKVLWAPHPLYYVASIHLGSQGTQQWNSDLGSYTLSSHAQGLFCFQLSWFYKCTPLSHFCLFICQLVFEIYLLIADLILFQLVFLRLR